MSLESVFKLSLVMNMIDNLTGPMARVSSSVGESVSRLDSLSAGFGSAAKTGAVMAAVGSQIAGAALAPVEATFETQRALGELSSLGVRDLDALETAARSFSDQWSGTSKADFISAAYDIKSGISSLSDEGVAEFTSLAALTAKATKATAGEMTSLFATGYGIYKGYYDDLNDIQFGEMFSAGISESVRAFKTSGSGMAQGIQTLGASATTANVPLEEQLAILGMLQATMGGSEAGTKYKAFLRTAAKGGEALGLSFLDANNQLLSMPEILAQLRGKFGETMDAAEKMELQKAFGDTEAVALIDLMYSKTGDLQDNILSLYGAMGQGTGVAAQMAGAMQETEPERFERLQQRLHNVAEAIGGSVLPAVNDFMSYGEQALIKVSAWIDENQQFVSVLMTIVLGLGSFLAVGGTALTVVGGIGIGFTKAASFGGNFIRSVKNIPSTLETIRLYGMYAGDGIRSGFSVIRTAGGTVVSTIRSVAAPFISAIGGMISSVVSFGAALLANPVTWVVIGIVAVIAVLVLLWNKCEWFRNGVISVINTVKGAVGAGIDFVKGALGAAAGAAGAVLDAAKATVSEKLDNMRAAYESHGGGIPGIAAAGLEGVKGVYTAGFSFLDHLTGGKLSEIRAKFGGAMGGIVQGVSQKLASARAAFSNGLNSIKSAVSGAVSWFFQSGQRVVSTFANGIRSAFGGAVTAVKGGLQNIRNMLPFSDAKEGPLSTLTLSGQRTMTTYARGLTLEQNAPAEAVRQGLSGIQAALSSEPATLDWPAFSYEPAPKVSLRDQNSSRSGEESDSVSGNDSAKSVIIQKLLLQVDLKKIKDLQRLLALLREVEDYANANGDIDPEGDPDAAYAPA